MRKLKPVAQELWLHFATPFYSLVHMCTHCKNGIINMTYSLSFWLQMSEKITHIDTDNYMTIHRKGTSYFDPTAHLMCFLFTCLKEMMYEIIAYVQCNYMCPGV